jgi:hypothetical protein
MRQDVDIDESKFLFVSPVDYAVTAVKLMRKRMRHLVPDKLHIRVANVQGTISPDGGRLLGL